MATVHCRHPAAGSGALQYDVDDTGYGVRAVLRAGAVAQDLDALDGAQRNGVEVKRVAAEADFGIERDDRRRVLPLAVNENQHMVRVHAAQLCRAHMIRCAGIRLAWKIE